jgi:hypothetical protein
MKRFLSMIAVAAAGAALVTGTSGSPDTEVAGGKGGVTGGDIHHRAPGDALAGGKGGASGGDVRHRAPTDVLVGGKGGIQGGDVSR